MSVGTKRTSALDGVSPCPVVWIGLFVNKKLKLYGRSGDSITLYTCARTAPTHAEVAVKQTRSGQPSRSGARRRWRRRLTRRVLPSTLLKTRAGDRLESTTLFRKLPSCAPRTRRRATGCRRRFLRARQLGGAVRWRVVSHRQRSSGRRMSSWSWRARRSERYGSEPSSSRVIYIQ